MSLYEILEEHPNFVVFTNISPDVVLYERIMGTTHIITGGDGGLVSELRKVKRPTKFALSEELIAKELSSDLDTLVLEVTQDCNLRCGYCMYGGNYSGERKHSTDKKEMSLETATRAMTLFSKLAKKNPHVSFFGGEPLLSMDLINHVIVVSKSILDEPTFNMTTNMLLAKKYAEFLVDNNILVAASLDGDLDVQDRFRTTAAGIGSFRYVMDGMARFKELSEDYFRSVVFTVTLSSPAQVGQVREFFRANYPDNQLTIGAVEGRFCKSVIDTYSIDNIRLFNLKVDSMARDYVASRRSGNDMDNFLKAYFSVVEDPIRKKQVGALPDSGLLFPTGACIPAKRKLYVDINGGLYACEKIGIRMPLGDVDTGLDLNKISQQAQDYVGYRNEVCGDCWAQRLCNVCYVGVKDETGLSVDGARMYCPTAKDQALTGLSLVTAIDHN